MAVAAIALSGADSRVEAVLGEEPHGMFLDAVEKGNRNGAQSINFSQSTVIWNRHFQLNRPVVLVVSSSGKSPSRTMTWQTGFQSFAGPATKVKSNMESG